MDSGVSLIDYPSLGYLLAPLLNRFQRVLLKNGVCNNNLVATKGAASYNLLAVTAIMNGLHKECQMSRVGDAGDQRSTSRIP